MRSSRAVWPLTPSNPKPNSSPNSLLVTAASSNGIRSERIQSSALTAGPSGCAPGTDQPPVSVSNEVSSTVVPAVTLVSSTSTPGTFRVP